MKEAGNTFEGSLNLIDAVTANKTRKNVVGTLFIGTGITVFAVGVVIILAK